MDEIEKTQKDLIKIMKIKISMRKQLINFQNDIQIWLKDFGEYLKIRLKKVG